MHRWTIVKWFLKFASRFPLLAAGITVVAIYMAQGFLVMILFNHVFVNQLHVTTGLDLFGGCALYFLSMILLSASKTDKD